VLKEVKRTSLKEYSKGEYHEGSIYDTDLDVDIALPCATQNEINLERAKRLVKNGVKVVAEGANMPDDNEAIKYYKENGVIFAPGKAANAGGVATSYLEMEQNAAKVKWSFEEVDGKLNNIMKAVHKQCLDAINEYGLDEFDYVGGANIAGATIVINEMVNE
ncbi:MAG: NADP-specific glutamate dehydrogenase, partial [Solobacterium sp.]|nr:NADP-specific glutamate dehydrogenase [Solobacterium sp.]